MFFEDFSFQSNTIESIISVFGKNLKVSLVILKVWSNELYQNLPHFFL